MKNMHVSIAENVLALCMPIVMILGVFQLYNADDVTHNAIIITLTILGPLVILNSVLSRQLNERLSELEKEKEVSNDEHGP